MLTAEGGPVQPQSPADTVDAGLCPLDGAPTRRCTDGYYVCTRCCEMLADTEIVDVATPETWAAYLAAGDTDTDPNDAPLARLASR